MNEVYCLFTCSKSDQTLFQSSILCKTDSSCVCSVLESDSVQRLFLNKLTEVVKTWHQRLPRCPMEDRHVMLAEFNQLFGKTRARAFYAVSAGDASLKAPPAAETLEQRRVSTMSVCPQRLRSGQHHRGRLCFRDRTCRCPGSRDSQALLVRVGVSRRTRSSGSRTWGGLRDLLGCWRVNGTYAVSRAIGDFDQKPYVSSEADCSTLRLQGDEDYLLLACDGFFDAVKPSEVPDLVLRALRRTPDPDEDGDAPATGADVAQRLVAHAKAAGSSDNITVMVVFLKAPEQLLEAHCVTAPQDSQHALHVSIS
uniref:Protein phosphatase, Mg2+/Mn2+ dependent, 1F n=1 Tax=Salarias fasciatus TaxID=181472 RepID=A0A672HQ92_SALFA